MTPGVDELTARCAADLAAARGAEPREHPTSPPTDGPVVFSARQQGAETIAVDLLARYDEGARHYHGRTHLAEMHAAFDALADAVHLTAERRLAGRLAVWFHDAIYDPRAPAGVNEGDSAHLAEATLAALGVPTDLLETVPALVLATADHRLGDGPALHDVGPALLDADLWILAAPPERFDEYCAQVRAEYAFVPEAAYASARSAILRDLLDRPRLYATTRAHDEWTCAARANVARELARLTG